MHKVPRSGFGQIPKIVSQCKLVSTIASMNKQIARKSICLNYRHGQVRMKTTTTESTPRSRIRLTDHFSLKDRVTVITGGSRGIGLELAKSLAEMGSDVALMDMRHPEEDVTALSKTFGTRFEFYKTDVTQGHSLEASFDSAIQDFGQIDNCVTAAGIALDKPFLETEWEESRRILDVNVLGTFFSVQLAARQMQKQKTGGSIVMIASIASHCALPDQRVSIYGGSKGAVRLLGKTLAVELAPLNIRVNTLSPGFINTEMTGALVTVNPRLWKVFNDTPPMHRIGEKEDLSGAVAFLLSDAARYCTGTDIAVTGGLHCGRIEC